MSDNNSGSSIKSKPKPSGFVAQTGQLKSKTELKEKIETSTDKPNTSTSATSSNVVSKSNSKVEERFRAEVSSVANDVNRKDAQLKQTSKSLKKEKEALQNLKQAFADRDEDKVASEKEKLRDLRTDREQNQEQIKREQRINSGEREIRLGDKQQGRVKIPELKLREVEKNIPQDAKEAKAQLEKVNEDIEANNKQKQDIQTARKELSDTLNSGKAEIDAISKDSLQSIDSAQQSASQISSDVKDLTKDELISTVAAKINPVSVSQALAS